jgi:uroporphyrinogen-III synthase
MVDLRGKRIFVLRAAEQSRELANALTVLGAEVITYPVLQFEPIPAGLEIMTVSFLTPFDQIIFTSSNAVRFAMEAIDEQSKAIIRTKEIYAVGPATASAVIAHECGKVSVPLVEYSAQGLLEMLPKNLNKSRILIPAAAKANPELEECLILRGAKVQVLRIYQTVKPASYPEISLFDGDMILFTSPSTVEHFFQSPAYSEQNIVSVCIGKTTRHALEQHGQNPLLARDATIDGIIEALMTCK